MMQGLLGWLSVQMGVWMGIDEYLNEGYQIDGWMDGSMVDFMDGLSVCFQFAGENAMLLLLPALNGFQISEEEQVETCGDGWMNG